MPSGRKLAAGVQTRREFLKAAGVGAAAMAMPRLLRAGEGPTAKPRRPNVVLVMTDDQGYGDLGCHGNKAIITPNLDKLHGESVRLTNFHVSPTCSPTRAALMTGRYCNRTGVWHTIMGRSLLRADEVTIADVFKTAGYATGLFGKWHLGDNYPFSPEHRGFDTVVRHGGGGIGQTPDYWGNDYFDDTYWHNGKCVKHSGYCTDVWFDEAMKFIESSARAGTPFFCYLPTNAPHSPYNVPPKYAEMYAGKSGVPNAQFYGMITNIDENMGRLVRKLDELGVADDTVLIFMTDNGTSAGFRGGAGFNAGMRGNKGSEYDGGHRVPCFIRCGRGQIGQPRDIGRLTSHIDILPTLAEFCGLKAPQHVKWDGMSLLPLLAGRDWGDRVIITDSQRLEQPVKWRKSAVMTDRWRLINGQELYDMNADPRQEKDVSGSHGKVVKKLRDEYDKWWADVSKRFDEYCRTVIGSDKANPVRLTCHDWHSKSVPWHQGMIRAGAYGHSLWAVEIASDGQYEFALRRWPEELDKPITAAIPGGNAVAAVKARLRIAGVDETKGVDKAAKAVTFKVNLKAGPAELRASFVNPKGTAFGAYYVYVRRIA